MNAYIVTYLDNVPAAHATLAHFRQSDWGAEPRMFVQPVRWDKGKPAASGNYKRALQAAADDGHEYALILEDDVRVCKHLRHNIETLPIVRRRQADLLTLFMPDLISDPWERSEPHLGYRLAKPRYFGPNECWEKFRLWGSQAYLFSRRMVRECLARWDQLTEGQDSRVLTVCKELQLTMFYTAPCLIEHVPAVTAFGTPITYAPDFDPDFKLVVGPGFQPPEVVPGWLTHAEGKLLYEMAAGRTVLELGTQSGRATVCLAQQATAVTSVDSADQSVAADWVRRYDLADRVTFHRGKLRSVVPDLPGKFDLILIDTDHDSASIARDIVLSLPKLAPGGLMAFHDYPDPGWPDVRPVVDDHARRLGWRRIAQADYLGVFRTPDREQVLTASDADVQTWFRRRWAEAERARASDLLRAVGAVLAEVGADWFVYGGTLLGLAGVDGMLPWDDDLDLLTVGQLAPDRLGAAAAKHGLRLIPHKSGLGWQMCLESDAPAEGVGFPFVDVGYGEVDGEEFVHPSMWGGDDRFPLADVLPIGTAAFDGVLVGAPANPAGVCRQKYGPACLESAVPPQWDHRTERPTYFPQIRVPLDRIRRLTTDR